MKMPADGLRLALRGGDADIANMLAFALRTMAKDALQE